MKVIKPIDRKSDLIIRLGISARHELKPAIFVCCRRSAEHFIDGKGVWIVFVIKRFAQVLTDCVKIKGKYKIQARLLFDIGDLFRWDPTLLIIKIEMRKENGGCMGLLCSQQGARQKIDPVIHISRRRKRKEGKRERTEEDR